MPSVSYLQKLGPEYLQQVFESARWIFERDRDIAFEVRILFRLLLHILIQYYHRYLRPKMWSYLEQMSLII